MEDLEQSENQRAFKRMFFIISIVVVIAIVTVIFFLLKKEKKEVFEQEQTSVLNSQENSNENKTLYSADVTSWKNYNWSGKINTHYPSNWNLKEKISSTGVINGLEIIPPTDNVNDVIFVGGEKTTCSSVASYEKNKCLKDLIEVPFYTNSNNKDVLAAFDLIIQNTILTEFEK